jgi:endonuclease YncB( thermonuclease family)
MKKILIAIGCFLAFSTVAAEISTNVVVGKTYVCVPHKIWDGDTFDAKCKVAGELRVRLHQADAPEKSQPRGGESTRWLSDAVWKQTVRVRVIEIEGSKGVLQARVVGHVTKNRVLINRTLVASGRAWAAPGYTKPGDAIRRAEAQAKADKLGLWDGTTALSPIAPWNWRHGVRHSTPTIVVTP